MIHAVEVEAVGEAADLSETEVATTERDEAEQDTAQVAPVFVGGDWRDTRFVLRAALRAGEHADRAGGAGRAAYLDPGRAGLAGAGHRPRPRAADPHRAARGAGRAGDSADPVLLEVFNNLYMSIAEQMGAVLENTAASVTVEERLDFSCAVFDAGGMSIANAPHMPVHLGSMGASVKAIVAQNPEMRPATCSR